MTAELGLLGLVAGLGLVLAGRSFLAGNSDLTTTVERYRRIEWRDLSPTGLTAAAAYPPRHSVIVTVGRRLARFRFGMGTTSLAQDLAAVARTPERHAIGLAWATIGGTGLPVIAGLLLRAEGVAVPIAVLAALTVAGGAGGLVAASVELKGSATRARSRFLSALSVWLELVSLAQAAGMGLESALEAAGRVSSDPAFEAIALAVSTARQAGESPWTGMARLGHEIGVPELDELAASLALAGAEGARIRSSLSAKSGSLRRRQLADAEARANSTTERLFIPSIILMLGFLVFLMYPAAVSLSHVL